MTPKIHDLADADSIRVVSDECGFELHFTTTDDELYRVNIQGVAAMLLSAVEREIAPWHREGMAVLAEWRRDGAIACDPDESGGLDEPYDWNDPKRPDFHSVHADHYDARER